MMISDFTTGFQTLIFLAFIQSSISATFCYLHTCIHALTEKCNIFRITEVKSRYCAIQYSNSICSHRAQADLGHALQNYVFKWSSEVTHNSTREDGIPGVQPLRQTELRFQELQRDISPFSQGKTVPKEIKKVIDPHASLLIHPLQVPH